MNKQTQSDKEKEKQELLAAARLLNRSQNYKQIAKRERLVQRLHKKSGRIRTLKPKRKDRDEIVARQKKYRAPVGAEG